MKKKILIIQHEDDTPAGTTLKWAEVRGLEVVYWRPALEPTPPSTEDLVGVVICGGSMDTFEEDQFPWLRVEKQFVRHLLEAQTKIFGLCLGAQLLAESLGGRVYKHPGWEVGFIPAKSIHGDNVPMFHWHQYTFELPPSATLLIEGAYCRNQAFTWGNQVVATQFHPESTSEWIKECANEIKEKHQGHVQSRQEILDSLPLQKDLQDWYFKELDALFLKK